MDDKNLLIERLERLAIVLDELMPGCAELVRDAIAMLKEQEAMMQCIKEKCRICPHCTNCDVDENGLLKEQETELCDRCGRRRLITPRNIPLKW